MGAFEQLFSPGKGEFEQRFSKNSNAQGGGGVEASIQLVHNNAACLQRSYGICLYDRYKGKLIDGRLL